MFHPARTPVHAVRSILRLPGLPSALAALLLLAFCCACGGNSQPQFAGPTISSFTAAKNVITSGDTTTLTVVYSAGQATIDQGVGPVVSGVPATIQPGATTAYTVTVTVNVDSQMVTVTSAPLTVKVVAAPEAPELVYPDSVEANHKGYVAKVKEPLPGLTYHWSNPNKSGATLDAGVDTPQLTFSTLYGLLELQCTATNEVGDSVSTEPPDEFPLGGPTVNEFTGTPNANATGESLIITDGTTVTLRYNISGGTGKIEQSGQPSPIETFKQGTGEVPVVPPTGATTTYTLTVTSVDDPTAFSTGTVTVSSVPLPHINKFTTVPSPLIIGPGKPATFLAEFDDDFEETALVSANTPGFTFPILNGVPKQSAALGETTQFELTVSNQASLTESDSLWVLVGSLGTFSGAFSGEGSADGTGLSGRFVQPWGEVVDPNGVLFVADTASHTIRRQQNGILATWAGTAGLPGLVDGLKTDARFTFPAGLAMDNVENLYVADSGNNALRRIDSAGNVTTYTGVPGNPWTSGGSAPGTPGVLFNQPSGVAYSPDVNSVFVANTGDGSVVQIDLATGAARPLPGVQLTAPTGMAYVNGFLWVADPGSNRIFQISILGQGILIQALGTGAAGNDDSPAPVTFNQPQGLAASGLASLMVADTGNSTLRRIDLNTLAVSTPFGTPGQPGTADGIGNAARFDHPRGVAFSSPVPGGSDLYVADTGNATLRKVAGAGGGGNAVATLSGRPPTRGSTDSPGVPLMRQPRQAALDAQGDDLYVADSGNHTIRQVAPDGTTLTWAGTAGQAGSANGAAIGAALFNTPSGVAVDAAGDVYVADTLNHTIRKITPESVNQVRTVSTLAGVAGQSGSSDSSGSGPTGALFNQPLGLSIDDSDGNVYVADSANHIIRQVEPDGTTTTWAGTPGTAGSADGPATGFGSALFNRPSAVAVGPGGVVYVADTFNHTLRIIQTDAAGVRRVDTLAGQAGMGDSVDNPVGQNARLDFPAALALDMDGNVFVANTGSSTVSVVTPEGSVSTFLGIKALSGVPDDLGTNPAPLPTRICPPYGVAVDPVSGHDFINFIYVVLDDAVLKVPLVPPEPSP
ncbi:MAG: hypothetical protein ABSH53_11735 [Holophaga sp.]|jgi:DNA-binding beta-propeller fold protein YncE